MSTDPAGFPVRAPALSRLPIARRPLFRRRPLGDGRVDAELDLHPPPERLDAGGFDPAAESGPQPVLKQRVRRTDRQPIRGQLQPRAAPNHSSKRSLPTLSASARRRTDTMSISSLVTSWPSRRTLPPAQHTFVMRVDFSAPRGNGDRRERHDLRRRLCRLGSCCIQFALVSPVALILALLAVLSNHCPGSAGIIFRPPRPPHGLYTKCRPPRPEPKKWDARPGATLRGKTCWDLGATLPVPPQGRAR